jgi:hypothetical protein
MGGGQSVLRHEHRRAAVLHYLGGNPIDFGRRQHDPDPGASGSQQRGYRESVSPREVYVEEYSVWARPGDSGKCLVTICDLIDELETTFHEQFNSRSAEVRVVVNNQDPLTHITHPGRRPPEWQSGEPYNPLRHGQPGLMVTRGATSG